MKMISILFLIFISISCESAELSDFSVQASECSHKIHQYLREPLSNAPNFATIRDVTKWLEGHLPVSIKSRFVEAGSAVSRSLEDWERRGMIHGPFWNTQAVSELLIAQSARFNGVAGCTLDDEIGVTREILQDQIYILLDLKNKTVEKMMVKKRVSDPYYAKMIVMYGVVLDFANIEWTDEQLAAVAKFRLELPEEVR